MKHSIVAAEGTFGPMMRLALPVLVEHLLHVLVEYVDLWLAGNYLADDAHNEAYVAAITQMGYVMWLTFTLFSVVAIGATALVARSVGAGDYENAGRATNQSLVLGAALAVAVMAGGYVSLDRFIALLQLRGLAAEYSAVYLWIILPVIPAIMVESVGIACLRGAGDMVSGLVVMTIVNVINTIVSAGLLLGLGPFPELGWEGLAYGSAVARVTGAVLILALLIRGRAHLQLRTGWLKPDLPMIRRLLRIGVPGGIDAISVVCCHLWFISIINQLGTLQTAAHGIGVRIEALAYMPGAAFQMAAATLAGQYLGAGQHAKATRSVLMACGVGVVIMSSAGVLFYTAARPLSEFFLGGADSAVVPISVVLLRIVAFTMPPLALTMVLSGALRGAGDTRVPLLFTLVGFLGIRIPLAYLLAHQSIDIFGWHLSGYGLGVAGAWYAMVVDVYFRCGLIVFRFLHGGWKRIEV